MLLRRSLASLTSIQQDDLVHLFELFILKRDAKRTLGQAVSDHGAAAVRKIFILNADQERWLRNRDFDHRWTYQRECEIAAMAPGLIPSSWIVPLYRQWLRWRSYGTTSNGRKLAFQRCTSEELFRALEVDAVTATGPEVRRAWMRCALKFHPDKNQHLTPVELTKCKARFLLVQDAYGELRKPGSVSAHREACMHRPSNEED